MDDDRRLVNLMHRQVSRRSVLAAGAAAAFLAACGDEVDINPNSNDGSDAGAVPDQIESDLSMYIWADYVDPKTFPAFEKEFDVKLTEDNYASNEEALAKLQAGAKGYDVIAPTGYMVE